MITTILFDIGVALVPAAAPGTPVDAPEVRLRPGTLRTVRSLAATYRIGAVTDTAVMTAGDVRGGLGGTGLDDLLGVIATSSDIGVDGPDPVGLRAAMTALDATPAQTLFVGDDDVDEAAAGAAGVSFARFDPSAPNPLASTVRRALDHLEGAMAAAAALVAPVDVDAGHAATARHLRLTKPPGSLGRLESLGTQLAAISGQVPPPLPRPAAVAVFAADHGVATAGVTRWPQAVTAQMVANIARGTAAINVLARQAGATVTVVDVGVVSDLDVADSPALWSRRIRAGTADLSREPAMTPTEARAGLDIGAEVAARLVDDGARVLVTGEMGIGNTTASAAVIAALTGAEPAAVTGRGAGIDDDMLNTKVDLITRALTRLPARPDPLKVLSEVGGLEIAALAGFVVGGASAGVPVVVDGVIAGAALLVAAARCPAVLPYVIAGHRSTEPGATAVLAHLGLDPVLDLGLRLGEGSGACLALGPLEAAALVLREMATFEDARVATTPNRSEPTPIGL